MALAALVGADEGKLICDFAETYHILDYRSLTPGMAATLAAGLGPESRCKKQAGEPAMEALLLAGILDRLSILVWMQTTDAKSGTGKPKMVTDALLGVETEVVGFSTAEEFERRRNEILGGD